jgi:hypothetical protein
MSYSLIDPPVTPFSTVAELEAWIQELQEMERDDAVEHELAQAQQWLQTARDREPSGAQQSPNGKLANE